MLFFEQAQRQPEGKYYDAFQGINLKRHQIDVTLANKSRCSTEVVAFHNNSVNTPSNISTSTSHTANEQGKHVVYFTGICTLYQDCLDDLAKAVHTTGASYYAFEYPGMSRLGGEVLEVNDLVNTGLALTNHLLHQGIPIDNIIFQGDSFGAVVEKKISDEFKKQSGVEIRCILNNTFSSFQEAVQGLMNQSPWTASLKPVVSPLLRYTGWNIRTGDSYNQVTPYQVHVNHRGDGLLDPGNATLAALVERNREQPNFIDICPQGFRTHRDAYSTLHWAEISPEGEEYLAAKYGRNDEGEVNTHLADLYYMQYNNGQGVYETLVSPYIQASNQYVANHPQELSLDNLPQPLESEQVSLSSLVYSVLPHVPSIPRFLSFFNRTPAVAVAIDVVEQELEKDDSQPKI
ncbi:Dot/Icm T4SS effector alpha/beta hydrolase [uncultured Legionella sp.]|uniref:Dot/Icm T4SS effector alpha/beta hydrolase n=1 Tax=uncultured Legionella sp. TaxID=210934 RepID=UPI00260A68E4|nr:Dot/Icm T4SS effector alpha/beta hydrolase [uncultured Legionella sp.]